MSFGYTELILIFLIVLLLFGGRKIPEVARGLGRGLREFKKARDDLRDVINEDDATESSEAPARGLNSKADESAHAASEQVEK